MTKNQKLWKCHGVRPTTQSCTNSIVANNNDERLEISGNQWVKLYWDKQKRYLPTTRYYACDECLNKFNKHINKIEQKMFIEIFGN